MWFNNTESDTSIYLSYLPFNQKGKNPDKNINSQIQSIPGSLHLQDSEETPSINVKLLFGKHSLNFLISCETKIKGRMLGASLISVGIDIFFYLLLMPGLLVPASTCDCNCCGFSAAKVKDIV